MRSTCNRGTNVVVVILLKNYLFIKKGKVCAVYNQELCCGDLTYDVIVISLVCYMDGWGWVVRNVRNNMSLFTV